MKLNFLFLMLYFPNNVLAVDCKVWFRDLEIDEKNCLIDCVTAETDMRTFHCSESCVTLCKVSIKKKLLFNLSGIYPELNKTERVLVAKYPKKMLIAYQMTWSAEHLCSALFQKSDKNDASDACRHFVWSALLYQKFGIKFAQQVLNAHEHNPKQPLREREMDLKNNQSGLIEAEQLLKQNKLNKKNILQSFQKKLSEGKLIILKKNSGDKK